MQAHSERLARILYYLAATLALPPVVLALYASFPKIGILPSVFIGEEILKPLAFFGLISAVVLTNSHAVRFSERSKRAFAVGALIDFALLAIIVFFTFTYLHESIVEKADQFPAWLRVNSDPMSRLISGPPAWIIWSALLAVAACLYLSVRTWGLPLAIVALVAGGYAVLCALSSVYGWAPGNVFLNYTLAARDPASELRKFLVIGDAHSLLGLFASILLRIVLPFVILGTLFAATGGGNSLIKLAFKLTSRLRGGSAHAAIVSSSLFGTVSGGPVVNVLATGVLTIPMMRKQGFSKSFSGGVEAAASSGGQIMPPVMGVAAFFLANFTGVPYSRVIVAAIIPAVLYYFCLFVTASLEARRFGMAPVKDIPENLRMTRQDWFNLAIIFVPILLIIVALATESFSASGAGILAMLILFPLAFIDPEIRKKPMKLMSAFTAGALAAGSIFLLFIVVAVVDSALSAVGFPNSFGALLASFTRGGLSLFGTTLTGGPYVLFVLGMTMLAALLLGMGMPTLPAYANVAIVMAGGLASLGLSNFTANLFVFYFATASAITPPVAVSAFAAASITKGDPIRTGIASVRLGIVMFLIPFVFAFYPELLIIKEAFIANPLTGEMIASRPNGFEWSQFYWILCRIILVIYVLATACAAWDIRALDIRECILRGVLAIGCLVSYPVVQVTSFVLLLCVLGYHRRDWIRMRFAVSRSGST